MIKRSVWLGQSEYYLSEDTHNLIESCVRTQQQEQGDADRSTSGGST